MNIKNKKIIIFGLFILLFVLIFTVPAMAKNNIALECKIDSFCCESGENTSAQMLVDNDTNYDTKWEANDGANHPGEPHWIILDFKSDMTFDSVRLIKASNGAGDFGRIEFDASGFKFETSSDKQNWTVISNITGNGGEDIYEGSFEPVTARYLKLTVTHPEQDEKSDENQTVRLYDLKVFEAEYIADEDEYLDDMFGTDPDSAASPVKLPPETSDSLLFFIILMGICIISMGVYKFNRKKT
jgi:hypothetical protein